jgi:hypothetical protein
MTRYTPLAIPALALKELRVLDDSGRPMRPFRAGETGAVACAGSPLRCCLRGIASGERVALVSYAPLRRWALESGAEPGAYDEAGPVFIHAEGCDGPGELLEYPFARPGASRTVRRYDAQGRIVGGALLEISQDAAGSFDRALDEAFAEPDVVVAHVRALEYGCFQFEVRRRP